MLENLKNDLLLHRKPNEFIAAVQFTAGKTGFQPELIEKDYFCSTILNYLYSIPECPLVFKGGTLLTKAYAGFYRLSEDLDFVLPASPLSTRKQRSDLARPIKLVVKTIADNLLGFRVENGFTGSNESRQYNATIRYKSLLSEEEGRILIEASLREGLFEPAVRVEINTILLDPFTEDQKTPVFSVQCLSKTEAYAEKIRAALTRERLAIRDFFDIDYAMRNNYIDLNDSQLMSCASHKIKVGGLGLVDFDVTTVQLLERKIPSELVPTLRGQDVVDFDLRKTIDALNKIIKEISF